MKQIEDYPNYFVTETGCIYSSKRDILLKGGEDKDGYILVTLQEGKRRRTAKVHREVARLYLPNPDNLPCVNHIDGNKQNNHPSNLEWCTVSHNTRHAYKLGALNQAGENNNACLNSDKQVKWVKKLFEYGHTRKEISVITRIPYGTVCSYISGRRRS